MFPGIFGFATKIGSALSRIRAARDVARQVKTAFRSGGMKSGLDTLASFQPESRPRVDPRVQAGTHKGVYDRGRLVDVVEMSPSGTKSAGSSRATRSEGHTPRRQRRRRQRGGKS